MNRLVGCLTVLVLLVAMPAWAYDGIVEKKTFAMPAYTTVGGTTIKGVRVATRPTARSTRAGTT